MESTLHFELADATDTYHLRLTHGAPDTLIYTDERISFAKHGYAQPYEYTFGAGHKESALTPQAGRDNDTVRVIRAILSRCRMYQFHDTSPESFIRQKCRIEDNRFLKHNAGNLAAVLYRLGQTHPTCYDHVRSCVRDVVDRFDDFTLEPEKANRDTIMLTWRERNSEFDFGPHQLSDGSLRAVALITLLSLPDDEIPQVIVIDEPELGLHPAAVSVIANLLKEASKRAQIILATQSMSLVNEFSLDDLVICDRLNGVSDISRRSPMDVDGWTDEYTLGQVWQSRALGAWPTPP